MYKMFQNAKVLFADNERIGRLAADALELHPDEWAVLPLRGPLIGYRISKAVILWPNREMTLREQKLHATWITEHLACKLPSGVNPITIY